MQALRQSIEPKKYNSIHIAAAIRIQKNWRCYQARKTYKKLVKKMKRKNYTAMQLITSERTYCDQLKFIIKEVLQPAKPAIDDPQLHEMLFCNIGQIFMLHHVFLFKFEKIMKQYNTHSSQLSVPLKQLFVQEDFQKHYTDYCFNYSKADKVMKLLSQNNTAFKQILKKSGIWNSARSLQSYMIKPVQRLCKYQVMLAQYFKNMGENHPDYEGIRDVIKTIKQLADLTNSQVEQFLYVERFRQLKFDYPDFFTMNPPKIGSQRKLVYENSSLSIYLINLQKHQEQKLDNFILFNDILMLIPNKKTEKPMAVKMLHIRKVQNMKYFKNVLQIVDPFKYYSFEFKTQNERDQTMKMIQTKTNYLKEKGVFHTVQLIGTQRRQSFFKFYTVYIAQIKQNDAVTKIYPRFKNLIRIQEILMKKNLFNQICVIALQKQNPNQTRKTRTIERRKFHIRQFLERIVNHQKIMQIEQIRQILDYYVGKICPKLAKAKAQEQLQILLPNWQSIKVHVGVKCTKIKELKQKICAQLQFIHSNQFQIFQIRDRCYSTKRLMYDDQSVKQIFQSQNSLNLNPFSDKLEYMFSRHYYLSNQEQLSLYKMDFIRLQLQLSVIKTQILTYSLQQDLMVTFMCLFAMYINLPLQDQRIKNFIKDLLTYDGKKSTRYKLTLAQFGVYYNQVENIVSHQQDQTVTVPFLIIKIISSNRLYQCQQFEVQIHYKCYKGLKKQIPSIDEQKITLGIKISHLMLLTTKQKHLIKSFEYKDIKQVQMHPNGIIFKFHDLESPFRVKTTQSYQINKLVSVYMQRDGTQKLETQSC